MRIFTYQQHKKAIRGFTLIELIVSIGIFMVVVTVAMSAYVNLISLDRKARATNDLVSNLSFVVNTMSRSIRTGFDYNCDGQSNCTSGAGTSFTYTDEDCRRVEYILKQDYTMGICRSLPDTGGTCTPSLNGVSCTAESAIPLTDPRIKITNLKFLTRGVGTGDYQQPNVIFTMTAGITPDANSQPITFTLEGAATQRLIELEN